MVTPLGDLLSRSWAFFQKNIVAILAGAVVMGVVSFLVSLVLVSQTQGAIRGAFGRSGVDPARMEELQQRVRAGDQQALQEMQQEVGRAMQNTPNLAASAGGMFGSVMSAAFISIALLVILSVVFNGYILLLILGARSVQEAAGQLKSLVLPLFGLGVWVFIRSFVWIPLPFVGIILAIILGPRFIAAPIFLVKEKKGIMASASESYAATKGYWGTIFLDVLAVGILSGIGMLIVNVLLRMVLSGSLAMLVGAVVQALVSGFIGIVIGYLGLSLLEQRTAKA